MAACLSLRDAGQMLAQQRGYVKRGTGTKVGDPLEVHALTNVLGEDISFGHLQRPYPLPIVGLCGWALTSVKAPTHA